MDFALFLESAVNGALVGLMYALVAIGIVLIYKSSSVPNLAQGAMVMLGAYIVLAFAGAGLPLWAAIPLGIVTMFCVGLAIERFALRRLAGRPIVMILMMTLGLDIFLRAGAMLEGIAMDKYTFYRDAYLQRRGSFDDDDEVEVLVPGSPEPAEAASAPAEAASAPAAAASDPEPTVKKPAEPASAATR